MYQRPLTSLVLSLALFAGASVSGQSLPPGFEESPNPNSSQLAEFADKIAEQLTHGEAEDIGDARETALERLNNPAVSVGFRLGLTDQLDGALREAIGDEGSALAAANALRIAGELGTSGASEIVVEALLDERAAIRYAAAAAAGRTLLAANSPAPPLRERPVTRLIEALSDRIKTDEHPEVVSGSMRALMQARAIDRGPLVMLGERAIVAMCEAGSERIAGLDSGGLSADARRRVLIGVIAANTRLRELLADVGRRSSGDVRRAAGGFAARGIGYALGAARRSGDVSGEISGDTVLVQLVGSAETVIFFAREDGEATKLAELLKSGETDAFSRAVRDLIGPGSPMTEPPFSYEGDEFLR